MKSIEEIREFLFAESLWDSVSVSRRVDVAELLAFLEDKKRDEVRHANREFFRVDGADLFGL